MILVRHVSGKKLGEVDWGVIQALYSAGVMTVKELAERTNRKASYISWKASTEKWLKPPRKMRPQTKAEIAAVQAEQERRSTRGREGVDRLKAEREALKNQKVKKDVNGNQIVTEKEVRLRTARMLADKLEENREEYVESMTEAALNVARHVKQLEPEKVLKNASSVESIDRMARRTLGLDQKEAEGANKLCINLSILRDSDPMVVIDADDEDAD